MKKRTDVVNFVFRAESTTLCGFGEHRTLHPIHEFGFKDTMELP